MTTPGGMVQYESQGDVRNGTQDPKRTARIQTSLQMFRFNVGRVGIFSRFRQVSVRVIHHTPGGESVHTAVGHFPFLWHDCPSDLGPRSVPVRVSKGEKNISRDTAKEGCALDPRRNSHPDLSWTEAPTVDSVNTRPTGVPTKCYLPMSG